jgi:hypothetical protein
MYRFLPLVVLLLLPAGARGDDFDHYTNDILAKVPKADGTLPVKELTPEMLVDHNRVLPTLKGALLVVRTNDGRWSKLLVQAAHQKIGDKKLLPILLIERFVTYKEGEERTVVAEGKNIRLFQEFQFNLDLGQVVPASVGGDLRLIVTADKIYVEPIGKAELYLVTKHLPEATPKKSDKVIVGAQFEPKYFNGSFELHDDGRRSGKLVLKVADNGDVTGSFYTAKDGAKYEVTGKVGDPNHMIKFKVQLPRSVVEYQGWMFTGDGRALCGVSRLEDRESGFYAVRLKDE